MRGTSGAIALMALTIGCANQPATSRPTEDTVATEAATTVTESQAAETQKSRPAPKEPSPGPKGGAAYISLNVEDADLHDVLRKISDDVGVRIIADPEIKATVTLTLDRVEWRHALDVIAKQTNCSIVTDPPQREGVLRLTRAPVVNLEFQDADLKTVLLLLANQGGVNLVLAEDVKGKISINLRGVPWREAIDVVARTAGYVVIPVKAPTKSSPAALRVRRR